MSLQDSIIERHERSYLITLEGWLDSSTYLEFEEKIGPVLSSSPRLLIFDLEKLDYISSMGIRSIVNARKAVESQDGHVVLIKLQPQIRKVFEIVSALPHEAVFSSVEEADRYLIWYKRKSLKSERHDFRSYVTCCSLTHSTMENLWVPHASLCSLKNQRSKT